jgi:lipopolysaccharide biosynthesis protein
MLADPESDMPFCLCWANENWTRRWDAADREILIEQQSLADDDSAFIRSLVPFLTDRRYIRIEGKPVLIVYRPQQLPDASQSARVWRDHCRSAGIGEICVLAALTHGNEGYSQFGFDGAVEFPPHNLPTSNVNDAIAFYDAFDGNVIQYQALAQAYLDHGHGSGRVFKSVFPSWDNTARTGKRALIVLNGTPENYQHWLGSTLDQVRQSGRADQFVFINAWNEWAEGCHLEPDRRYGRRFLEATLKARNGVREFSTFPDRDLPPREERPGRTFFGDIRAAARYHASIAKARLRRSINRRPWLRTLLLPLVRLARGQRVQR